jgi:hypothetical protein
MDRSAPGGTLSVCLLLVALPAVAHDCVVRDLGALGGASREARGADSAGPAAVRAGLLSGRRYALPCPSKVLPPHSYSALRFDNVPFGAALVLSGTIQYGDFVMHWSEQFTALGTEPEGTGPCRWGPSRGA